MNTVSLNYVAVVETAEDFYSDIDVAVEYIDRNKLKAYFEKWEKEGLPDEADRVIVHDCGYFQGTWNPGIGFRLSYESTKKFRKALKAQKIPVFSF